MPMNSTFQGEAGTIQGIVLFWFIQFLVRDQNTTSPDCQSGLVMFDCYAVVSAFFVSTTGLFIFRLASLQQISVQAFRIPHVFLTTTLIQIQRFLGQVVD